MCNYFLINSSETIKAAIAWYSSNAALQSFYRCHHCERRLDWESWHEGLRLRQYPFSIQHNSIPLEKNSWMEIGVVKMCLESHTPVTMLSVLLKRQDCIQKYFLLQIPCTANDMLKCWSKLISERGRLWVDDQFCSGIEGYEKNVLMWIMKDKREPGCGLWMFCYSICQDQGKQSKWQMGPVGGFKNFFLHFFPQT